jgi:hypothetical protein
MTWIDSVISFNASAVSCLVNASTKARLFFTIAACIGVVSLAVKTSIQSHHVVALTLHVATQPSAA